MNKFAKGDLVKYPTSILNFNYMYGHFEEYRSDAVFCW